MTDPVSRRDIASLADLRWLFERQLFSSRMALATRLVAAFPETTFVLVHAGTLEDTDPGTVETWRQGVRLLAEQSDVVVELTGQGTLVHPRRPGPRRPGHRHLPELSASHRCTGAATPRPRRPGPSCHHWSPPGTEPSPTNRPRSGTTSSPERRAGSTRCDLHRRNPPAQTSSTCRSGPLPHCVDPT
jgi:hypothetical protein